MQNDMETTSDPRQPTWTGWPGSAWQAMLVMGIASFALGLIVLVWPGPSLRVVGVLFGVYLLVSGNASSWWPRSATTCRRRCASWRFHQRCAVDRAGPVLRGTRWSRSCCSRCGSASAGCSAASRR
ncbi:DUF308 domain-containing protein [Yinghuangia aomiensis]